MNNNNFDKCIELAMKHFSEIFDFKINQFLIEYPEIYLNEEASKFWSGSKNSHILLNLILMIIYVC